MTSLYAGALVTHEQIIATLERLRLCAKARAAGYPVSFTSDPAWLVNQSINRKAGWPDDPGCWRGSCLPVARNRNKARYWDDHDDASHLLISVGRRDVKLPRSLHGCYTALVYPAKAIGETYGSLRLLARRLNTPRLRVDEREVPLRYRTRISTNRLTTEGEV